MLALSIRQPWAFLIASGIKDVENRTWPTRQRGRILIHAGKVFDLDGWKYIRSAHPEILLPGFGHFRRGGIVGSVVLIDCVQASESPWFEGPFGFVFDPRRCMATRFRACRGQPGFFDIAIA
jgi:hypothetical protein